MNTHPTYSPPACPPGWRAVRLRYLGALSAGGVDKKIQAGQPLVRSVHYVDVYRNSLQKIGNSEDYLTVSASPAKQRACSLETGDVLFTASSETPEDIGHSCVVGADLDHTVFGYHLMRLRPTVPLHLDYEKYLFGADYLRKWFAYRATGITRYGLSAPDYADAVVLVPPLEEQAALAAYLDEKTGRIDALIADKERLIALLKDTRRSIVNEAVAQGLHPERPKKDSGTDWLGDIPAHWQVSKSRWLFGLRKERARPEDRQLTASQQYGIVYQEDFMRQGARVVQVITGSDILRHVEPGDFVISMRSFQGGIEWSRLRGKISSAYVMLIPNAELVYPPYFHWLLKSPRYIQALQRTSNLVRDGQALRYDNFKQVDLPVIPLEEQREIAAYLNGKTAQIDALVQENQRLIDLLKAYRQAIINEAATGRRMEGSV